MNKLTSFLEKLVDFMSYLKIVASPAIVGAFLGAAVYVNKTDSLGLTIGIVIAIIGITIGILLAEWAKKHGGTTELISRVNASPDIDEAVRASKLKSGKHAAIENLKAEERYFKGHIIDNKSFQPEYEISNEINQFITTKPDLTKEDFDTIINLFNKIEDNEHYDGSGWENYKIRISQLFYAYGYNLKWDERYKKITAFNEI